MRQKASGAPFMAFAGMPTASFVVTRGSPAIFPSSEIAERGFCALCGTPLTYRGRGDTHFSVTLGSLDGPAEVAPGCKSASNSACPGSPASHALPAMKTEEWMARKNISAIRNRQHPDHEI